MTPRERHLARDNERLQSIIDRLRRSNEALRREVLQRDFALVTEREHARRIGLRLRLGGR